MALCYSVRAVCLSWYTHALIGRICLLWPLWRNCLAGRCLGVTCTSVIEILVCKWPLSWCDCILLGQGACSHQRKLLFALHRLNTEADRQVWLPWTYPCTAVGQTTSQLACKFLSKWSPQTPMKGILAKMCHLLACFTLWTTSVDYASVKIQMLEHFSWLLNICACWKFAVVVQQKP